MRVEIAHLRLGWFTAGPTVGTAKCSQFSRQQLKPVSFLVRTTATPLYNRVCEPPPPREIKASYRYRLEGAFAKCFGPLGHMIFWRKRKEDHSYWWFFFHKTFRGDLVLVREFLFPASCQQSKKKKIRGIFRRSGASAALCDPKPQRRFAWYRYTQETATALL